MFMKRAKYWAFIADVLDSLRKSIQFANIENLYSNIVRLYVRIDSVLYVNGLRMV